MEQKLGPVPPPAPFFRNRGFLFALDELF